MQLIYRGVAYTLPTSDFAAIAHYTEQCEVLRCPSAD
jgi:hypothetical protein